MVSTRPPCARWSRRTWPGGAARRAATARQADEFSHGKAATGHCCTAAQASRRPCPAGTSHAGTDWLCRTPGGTAAALCPPSRDTSLSGMVCVHGRAAAAGPGSVMGFVVFLPAGSCRSRWRLTGVVAGMRSWSVGSSASTSGSGSSSRSWRAFA
jgi:hypothetical protein